RGARRDRWAPRRFSCPTVVAPSNNSFATGLTPPIEILMQGDAQILDALNRALTIELTAINQYFVQAKMCNNWGFRKLGGKHYEESIGEMKHAEKLIDR